LIELIVVIVILGILSATALPKFVNISSDARSASVKAMTGTLNTSAQLVKSAWQVRGASGGTVTMAGGSLVTVDSATGVPTADATGIGAAINCTGANCGGYIVTFGFFDVTFSPSGSGAGSCLVAYAGDGTVTPDTSGC
jgi:MSHA pilin protein MshA